MYEKVNSVTGGVAYCGEPAVKSHRCAVFGAPSYRSRKDMTLASRKLRPDRRRAQHRSHRNRRAKRRSADKGEVHFCTSREPANSLQGWRDRRNKGPPFELALQSCVVKSGFDQPKPLLRRGGQKACASALPWPTSRISQHGSRALRPLLRARRLRVSTDRVDGRSADPLQIGRAMTRSRCRSRPNGNTCSPTSTKPHFA